MKKRLNTLMLLTQLLLGIYFGAIQVLLTSIADAFYIDSTFMGLLASAYFIGGIIFTTLFGMLSDEIGKKKILVIGYGVYLFGLAGVVLSPQVYLLLIFMITIGGGGFIMQTTLSDILAINNPMGKSRLMNFSIMCFSIGAVIGPLVTVFMHWKTVILFIMGLTIVLGRFIIKVPMKDHKDNITISKDIKKIKHKTLLLILIISMFIYISVENIAFWLNDFFVEGINKPQYGAYTVSAFHGLMVFGRLFTGVFSKYEKRLVFSGLALSLVSSTIALIIHAALLKSILFALVGLGYSAVWPYIMSKTSETFKQRSGLALGMVMTAGAIGGIVSPIVVGTMIGSIGFKMSFFLYPILIFLLILLQINANHKKEKRIKKEFL